MATNWEVKGLIQVKKIGKGSFGKVYKVKGLVDKKDYAVKEIDIRKYINKTKGAGETYQTLPTWISNITKEVCQFLANFNSKYVVPYKDCWFSGPGAHMFTQLDEESSASELSSGIPIPHGWLCIKMDYCESNLKTWLKENNTPELRLPHVAAMFQHILKGLEYIHERNVIHRDIKPANIMIKLQPNSKLLLQIGDFGLSTKMHITDLSRTNDVLSGPVGTPMYMSPEMPKATRKTDYNCKTDVFSAALVFLEVLTILLNPADKERLGNRFNEIRAGSYRFPSGSPTIEVIKQMVTKDFGKRPSAKEALKLLDAILLRKTGLAEEDYPTSILSLDSSTFSLLSLDSCMPQVKREEYTIERLPALISALKALSTGPSLRNTNTQTLSDSGNNRNVVIEINNHVTYSLRGGSTYLHYGYAEHPPPTHIDKHTKEAMLFNKVGDTATGTVGILSYTIVDPVDPVTFAVFWSVPFNYIHSRNWLGLRILRETEAISYKLYDEAWYDESWTSSKRKDDRCFKYADSEVPVVVRHEGYVISARMSDCGQSIINVTVLNINSPNLKD